MYGNDQEVDGNALLMGAEKSKACSFDGTFPIVWEGVVLDEPKGVQQRDYDNEDELLWWDDEKTQPKMAVVVKLQTDVRDDDEDTGVRSLWLKGNSQRAVVSAVRQAGAAGIKPGGYLWIEYYGEEETKPRPGKTAKKRYPTKLYRATYTPPPSAGNQALMSSMPEPAYTPTMPEPSGRSVAEVAAAQSAVLRAMQNRDSAGLSDGPPPF